MAFDIVISGHLTDVNRRGNPLPFELNLGFRFMLLPPIEQSGIMVTERGGEFSKTITVTDEDMERLEKGAVVRLDIWFAPQPRSFTTGEIFGTDRTALEVCQESQRRLGDLTIEVDLSEFDAGSDYKIEKVKIVTEKADTLGGDALKLHFYGQLTDQILAGTVAERRVRDGKVTYVGDLLLHPDYLDRPHWLRAKSCTDTTVIFRTRVRSEELDPILVSRVETVIPQHDLNQLEDRYRDGIILRNMQLKLENEHFFVEGDVGWGTGLYFQVFEICRFALAFDVKFIIREDGPFQEGEFDQLFKLNMLLQEVDLFPGTDIDERCGIIGLPVDAVEQGIVDLTSNELNKNILSSMAAKVRATVNAEFEQRAKPLRELAPSEPEIVDEMRRSLFFQPEDFIVSGREVRLAGYVGIWHWTAGLQDLLCPATTLSSMYPRFHLLPIFRRAERLIKECATSDWKELYKKHKKELVKILLLDRSIADSTAKFFYITQSVVEPETNAVLTKEVATRLSELLELYSKASSSELQSDIQHLLLKLRSAAGKTLGDVFYEPPL